MVEEDDSTGTVVQEQEADLQSYYSGDCNQFPVSACRLFKRTVRLVCAVLKLH
jgi:hypothetical protein